MSEVNIDELVSLDRYALDVEAERSAANLQTVGQLCAEARANKDAAEAVLKRVYGETELMVRKIPPAKFGLEKFTESSISAIVESSKEVEEATSVLLDAKKKFYELEAAVSALSDKSSRIKDLTSLWIGGYFAEPTTKKKDKYETR